MGRGAKYDLSATGTETVKKGLESINQALTESGLEAIKTSKAYSEINAEATKLGNTSKGVFGKDGVFANIKHAMDGQTGAFGKMSAALSAAKGGFDNLTGSLKNFGGVIQGAAGLLGPYGMLIGGIVTGITALYAKWADPGPPALATDALDRQAEAAERLAAKLAAVNDTISASQAMRQIKQEDAITAARKAYVDAQASLSSLEAQIQIKRNELEEAKRGLITDKMAYDLNAALWDDSYAVYYEKTVGHIEKAIKRLEEAHQEALKTVREGDIQAEFNKLFQLLEEDAVAEVEVAAQQHQRALAKAHEAFEKRKELAKKAREQYRADEAALSAIIQEGAAARWRMVTHSAVEEADYATEQRKKAAQKQIKDAELLQAALTEIDAQGAIARRSAEEKDAEAAKKRIADVEALRAKVSSAGKSSLLAPEVTDELTKLQVERSQITEQAEQAISQIQDAIRQIDAMSAEEQAMMAEERMRLIDREYAIQEAAARRRYANEQKYAEASHKLKIKAIKDEIALSEATRKGTEASITGLTQLSEAAKLWGANAGAVQVMEMTASCIKAGADAADYAAESVAAFANMEILRGTGLAAASVAKLASAAAYAKGISEIGGSAPAVDTSEASRVTSSASSSSSSSGTKSLTGDTGRSDQHQTIDINLMYSGGGPELANALIRGLNASANNSGMSRINPVLIGRS